MGSQLFARRLVLPANTRNRLASDKAGLIWIAKNRFNVTNKFTWFRPRCSCDKRGELGERDNEEKAGPVLLVFTTFPLKWFINCRTISSLKTNTGEKKKNPSLSVLHVYSKAYCSTYLRGEKNNIKPFLMLFWEFPNIENYIILQIICSLKHQLASQRTFVPSLEFYY